MSVSVESHCWALARESDRREWAAFEEQSRAMSQLLRPFCFAVWPEVPRPHHACEFMLTPMHFGDLYGTEAANDKRLREMRRGIAPGDLGL